MAETVKVAIVQSGPVYLDRAGSLRRALTLLAEAAAGGAQLVVFGETWFSGYPIWLDICPGAGLWNDPAVKQVYARTHAQALTLPGPETEELGAFARKHNLAIAFGANESIPVGPGNGTLYNALVIIGPEGKMRVHHRKLMPTHGERLVHGTGDGHGLKSVDLGFARVGGLICWEHWMPLTRQAMHDQGEQIHLALWPQVKEQNALASQHYALEGRCFVVAVGQTMAVSELPGELETPAELRGVDPQTLILRGGSCAYGPDGRELLAPQRDREGLIWLEIDDLDACVRERMNLDVSGHYQRRDVFDFSVDDRRRGK
ncbi:MAG: carbon-nitrogen hydrolase family protein [Bacteroidota bacterium]